MSENQPTDDITGKKLGQYEIMEEIGRGGMATVYRGRQQSMNRVVAVKVLPRNLLHDPGFYERFEREVDVIAHLEHPHILPIYDYGQEDGIPYIIMRYLAGGSLEQRIRRGISSLEELEKPLRQIAQALDYAHREGVIHRDLKPGNIMLDQSGNAYLSDFGIARVLGSELTGSMIIGTPSYMSPEQANGLPLDGRSDIYGLGVVLFELITGRLPYQAPTPMAVLLKHISEPMPPLRDFRPDAPPEVEAVVEKATAKDPDDRYSSASDMAAAYAAALRGLGGIDTSTKEVDAPADSAAEAHVDTGSIPVGQPTPAAVTRPESVSPVVVPTATPISEEGAQPVGRGRTLMGGLAVMLLLIVAAGVVFMFISGDDDPPVVDAGALVPTPFFRAETVSEELYSISIPQAWIPTDGYYDLSDTNRLVHVWQPEDRSAYAAIEMLQIQMESEDAFRAAIDDYDQTYISVRGNLEFIDEDTAEDGTIRRSYRFLESDDAGAGFGPGQLDVFFKNRSPYLTVINVYSSDSVGNTMVNTLQQILDSVRVSPS